MRLPDRFAPFLTFLLLSIIVAVLYAPGLRGAYYGDDLMFVRPLHGDLLRPFVHANPETGWYRPLEATLLGTIQDRFGLQTWPIHVLALMLHVAIALLVARLTLRLGLGRGSALASALAFAITQACASAVLGNDTLSQLLATAFGMCAVVLFAAPLRAHRSAVPRVLLGALCVLLAMLAKEAGVGWAAAAMLSAVVAARAHEGRMSRAILALAVIAVTVAGYLLLRDTMGARPVAIGPGRYDLDPGPAVLVRLAMLLGVTVLPVSTVTVAEAWARGLPTLLVMVAVIELAILAALAVGMVRRPKLALLLLAGAALALGPVIAIRHVSELYAYTAMPFAAIGIGALAASALRSRGPRRWAVVAAIAVAALLHGFAVRQKATLAAANGERARTLLTTLEPVVAHAPAGGSVLLVQAHGLPPGYSVYRQVGFEPVEFSESFLRHRTGRNDVHVRMVSPAEARALASRTEVRALTLMGDDLVPFPAP